MAEWTYPGCWKLHDDAFSNVETSAYTLAALQREWGSSGQPLKKPPDRNAAYPYRSMYFHFHVTICFQIANSCTRWRCNFKGLSQHGGRADFSKNLRASLFNNDLSNEPNICRNHLAGQYLMFIIQWIVSQILFILLILPNCVLYRVLCTFVELLLY